MKKNYLNIQMFKFDIIFSTAYNVNNLANNSEDKIHSQHLKLKGQMMLLNNGEQLIYLCSPYVTSIPELFQVIINYFNLK